MDFKGIFSIGIRDVSECFCKKELKIFSTLKLASVRLEICVKIFDFLQCATLFTQSILMKIMFFQNAVRIFSAVMVQLLVSHIGLA